MHRIRAYYHYLQYRRRHKAVPSCTRDIYKTSRTLYIIEAALEYFVSLLVSGAFLAKVSTHLGISDSLTGVITAFVSLGCSFQMLSIFLSRKSGVKRMVITASVINELLFAAIYLTPFVPLSSGGKTVVFMVCMMAANIIHQMFNSPKIGWYMSLVDDRKRGVFTANKEIISLIGGMIFTTVMGNVMDRFEAAGNLRGGFIVCGITLFALMVGHTLTFVFSKEKPQEDAADATAFGPKVRTLLKNRLYIKAVAVGVLWNVATHCATPFYATYQINELGFSLSFVAILGVISSVVRALFSRGMGRFADRHSFADMMLLCMLLMGGSFGVMMFTVPQNGYVLFTVYTVLCAVANAGINSALINLVFDYAPNDLRSEALALQRTVYGLGGFFAALAVSPLITYIQGNANGFLGMTVYAQQVTSALALILTLAVAAFLYFGMIRNQKAVTV